MSSLYLCHLVMRIKIYIYLKSNRTIVEMEVKFSDTANTHMTDHFSGLVHLLSSFFNLAIKLKLYIYKKNIFFYFQKHKPFLLE